MSLGKRTLNALATWLLSSSNRRMRDWPQEKIERRGLRLGRAFYRLSKKHRRVCRSNLAMAFPEKSDQERLEIERAVFEHFGREAADFAAGLGTSLERLTSTTEVRGLENLDAALDRGKGVMMVTGHFGNWERVSTYLTLNGHPLTVVARNADDEGLNKIVNELRGESGVKVVPRGAAARPMMSALKRNELIGILPDQNSADAYIDFFGKPAGTVLGPGVIAERAGAPILPVYCVRTGPAQYRLVIDEIIEPQPGGDPRGLQTMTAINAWLEGVVRSHPEQWLWFHDRWRYARRAGLL